jgi:tRNA-modifying protein YgfZ
MESLGKTTVNLMHSECNTVSLGSLGVLRARGADVVPFLQGQVSNDMARLAADRSLLAGYHNPQGRVIGLLRLVQLAADDVLAVLPRELVAPVAQRLAKFILRAKVRLADESAEWTLSGMVSSGSASSAGALPDSVDAAARVAPGIAIRLGQQPARWLLVSPRAQAPAPAAGTTAAGELWQRLALAAGEPEVYAATSGEFLAQMLNLDALGAIAFDKGCYTGQEVIARAHYRGRVKRRMQRFLSEAAVPLAAGDSGVLADGRTFKVVRAARHPDGRCEFLAVTTIARDAPPAAEPPSAGGAAEAGGALGKAASAGEAPLPAHSLDLPYALPE